MEAVEARGIVSNVTVACGLFTSRHPARLLLPQIITQDESFGCGFPLPTVLQLVASCTTTYRCWSLRRVCGILEKVCASYDLAEVMSYTGSRLRDCRSRS